jgi:membrane protein implicated in regulation of membrane protease activity
VYLIAIAWAYVALMMAAAEALSPNGSLFGALITLLLYGVLPLSLLFYILGTPGRKRRLRAAESAPSAPSDDRGHAPAGEPGVQPLAPEREEP